MLATTYNFAFSANFFNTCSNFHNRLIIRPRFLSTDNSTSTLSPTRTLIKFSLILPDKWAKISVSLSIFTLKVVFGKASMTVPLNMGLLLSITAIIVCQE